MATRWDRAKAWLEELLPIQEEISEDPGGAFTEGLPYLAQELLVNTPASGIESILAGLPTMEEWHQAETPSDLWGLATSFNPQRAAAAIEARREDPFVTLFDPPTSQGGIGALELANWAEQPIEAAAGAAAEGIYKLTESPAAAATTFAAGQLIPIPGRPGGPRRSSDGALDEEAPSTGPIDPTTGAPYLTLEDINEARPPNYPPLYSRLERETETAQARQQPRQWLKWIQNQGHNLEARERGLVDWLTDQEGTVDRENVLGFLRNEGRLVPATDVLADAGASQTQPREWLNQNLQIEDLGDGERVILRGGDGRQLAGLELTLDDAGNITRYEGLLEPTGQVLYGDPDMEVKYGEPGWETELRGALAEEIGQYADREGLLRPDFGVPPIEGTRPPVAPVPATLGEPQAVGVPTTPEAPATGPGQEFAGVLDNTVTFESGVPVLYDDNVELQGTYTTGGDFGESPVQFAMSDVEYDGETLRHYAVAPDGTVFASEMTDSFNADGVNDPYFEITSIDVDGNRSRYNDYNMSEAHPDLLDAGSLDLGDPAIQEVMVSEIESALETVSNTDALNTVPAGQDTPATPLTDQLVEDITGGGVLTGQQGNAITTPNYERQVQDSNIRYGLQHAGTFQGQPVNRFVYEVDGQPYEFEVVYHQADANGNEVLEGEDITTYAYPVVREYDGDGNFVEEFPTIEYGIDEAGQHTDPDWRLDESDIERIIEDLHDQFHDATQTPPAGAEDTGEMGGQPVPDGTQYIPDYTVPMSQVSGEFYQFPNGIRVSEDPSVADQFGLRPADSAMFVEHPDGSYYGYQFDENGNIEVIEYLPNANDTWEMLEHGTRQLEEEQADLPADTAMREAVLEEIGAWDQQQAGEAQTINRAGFVSHQEQTPFVMFDNQAQISRVYGRGGEADDINIFISPPPHSGRYPYQLTYWNGEGIEGETPQIQIRQRERMHILPDYQGEIDWDVDDYSYLTEEGVEVPYTEDPAEVEQILLNYAADQEGILNTGEVTRQVQALTDRVSTVPAQPSATPPTRQAPTWEDRGWEGALEPRAPQSQHGGHPHNIVGRYGERAVIQQGDQFMADRAHLTVPRDPRTGMPLNEGLLSMSREGWAPPLRNSERMWLLDEVQSPRHKAGNTGKWWDDPLSPLEQHMMGLEGPLSPDQLNRTDRAMLENFYQSQQGTVPPTPMRPGSKWIEHQAHRGLADAVSRNADWFGWNTGENIQNRWGSTSGALFEKIYDKVLPKAKIWKRLGLTPERVRNERGQEVWGVRLTPETREKLIREGIPYYSVGGMLFLAGMAADQEEEGALAPSM